jgi:cyclopropane fatty-acyl-phospholipid synthase-like methyltransferase
MRKRGKPIVAAPVEKWDAEYQDGIYDRLNRSDQRHHHRLLAAMIADRWPNPRVLEIGAGEGVFYEALRAHRPARYVGVDFSKPAVDLGEVRLAPEIAIGEVKMLLGDGRAFQTDETFDVVVFSECVEHLGEVEAPRRPLRAEPESRRRDRPDHVAGLEAAPSLASSEGHG